MKFIKNINQRPFNDIGDGRSLKEIAGSVMLIEGNVKGETILNNISYIKRQKGEQTIKGITDKMKELGYVLEFEKISSNEWYKESYNVVINLIMKDVFGWGDNDIFDSGKGAARVSFFLKSIIQNLLSPTILVNNANKYWQRQLDFGKINAIECNEVERKIVLGVEGYNKSSISCTYQAGYFAEVIGYSIRDKKNLQIEETKCIHAGDDYHEYTITW